MISDLSPGDRLSLKGKLFELQRKLNLIDLEHKLDEQYPYKPTILEYDLPNRIPANFVENSNKAEIIRKQKKKMLADSLQSQTDETCTFQPRIYTQQKNFHVDNRPVHIRLGEKGKEYQDQLERRKQQYTMYDDRGRRLFTPKINHHRPSTSIHTSGINTGDSSIIMEGNPQFMSPDSNGYHEQYQTSQFPVPGPQSTNTISAEEFLYQDAKDRELRLRNLVANHEEEIRQSANGTKINPTSKKMLIQKADRHTRHVFSLIDKNGDNVVSYEDVSIAMEKYKLFSNQEQLIKSKELFWEVIDHHKDGAVERVNFQDITIPFLLQKSLNAIVPAIQKKELSRLQQQQQQSQSETDPVETSNDVIELRASALQFMKEKDLQEFKDILMKFIDAAERKKIHDRNKRVEARNKRASSSSLTRNKNESTSRNGSGGILANNAGEGGEDIRGAATNENQDGPGEGSSSEEQEENFEFKPKILPHSFKLAQQKVKKDLALLAGLMTSSGSINIKGSTSSVSGVKNTQQDGQQYIQQNQADVVSDSSPPPPPPPSSKFQPCEGVMLGGELDEDPEEEVAIDNDMGGTTITHQHSVATDLGSNASVLASPESAVSHYDLMHARALISKQKKEQLKTTIMKRELEKCTFQPKLVTKNGTHGRGRSRSFDRQSTGASIGGEFGGGESLNIEDLSMTSMSFHPEDKVQLEDDGVIHECHDQDHIDPTLPSSAFSSPQSRSSARNPAHHSHSHHPQVPVHERLYALQNKKNMKASSSLTADVNGGYHLSSPPPSYVQELQACSFKPKIGPQPPANIKAQLVTKINGTEKTIQRMKEFHEKKQKAKEDEDNAWKELDVKYQKSRELLKNKMIPFQSNLEVRRKAKQEKDLQRQKELEDSRGSPNGRELEKDQFYVNIKVAVNKSAKIRVSRGDDPAELAHRFGMIYSLDVAAVQVLSTVLYESMVQHKFIIKPEDASKSAASPAKEDAPSSPSRPSTPSSSKHGSHSQSKPGSNRRSIRRSFLEQTAEALFGNPFGARPLPADYDMEDGDGNGEGDEEQEDDGEEFEEDELEYDDGEGEDFSTFRSHDSHSDGSFIDDGEDEEHSYDGNEHHHHEDDEQDEEEVHNIHNVETSDTDMSHGYKKYRLHGDDGPRGNGKKKKSVLADLL